jgi:4-hydroxybutyrate dehydrogenase/sulfolactaldehyde 3-reductase
MPMAAAAREAFSSARARGFGGKDFSGMLEAHCELTGSDIPRLSHNSRHKSSS